MYTVPHCYAVTMQCINIIWWDLTVKCFQKLWNI